MDANRRIGCSWTTGNKKDSGLAGQLAVCFGHEGTTALIAAADKFETVGHIKQRVQYGQVAFHPARQTPYQHPD